jgi:hypothetical protein
LLFLFPPKGVFKGKKHSLWEASKGVLKQPARLNFQQGGSFSPLLLAVGKATTQRVFNGRERVYASRCWKSDNPGCYAGKGLFQEALFFQNKTGLFLFLFLFLFLSLSL